MAALITEAPNPVINVYKTTTPIPVITVNLKGNLKTVNIKKNQKPYIKATFIPLAASI